MKKIRRLPTILGIIILLVGIGAGVLLVRQLPYLLVKAGPETTPKEVNITNITEGGFTVSWITDGQVSGFIKYGTNNNLTLTAKDDRDRLSGETENFETHHVTLENLNPTTKYYFKIGSGANLFDNGGAAYQVITGSAIQMPAPPSNTAYGTILNQAGSPIKGAIIYLSLANGVLQSALTTSSGVWSIPLNLTRSESLSSYLTYDLEASIETIKVQGASLGTAEGRTTTKRDSPVPDITLGQNFDYVTSDEKEDESSEEEKTNNEEEAATGDGFNLEDLGVTPSPTASGELSIINPEESEEVNTQQPEILGTGPAGGTIKITVESSSTYSGEVLVDSSGNWQWTPPSNLEPGEHTITASYTDEEGQEKTVSHSFVVLAAGEEELPALTATPSGEASPSPTPAASPSPTPTPRASMPSTEGGVPDSGNVTPTFLVFLAGLILITLGFSSRFFLNKG